MSPWPTAPLATLVPLVTLATLARPGQILLCFLHLLLLPYLDLQLTLNLQFLFKSRRVLMVFLADDEEGEEDEGEGEEDEGE